MKGKKGGKQQLDSSPPQQGPSNEQQQQTGIASTEDLGAEADGRRSGNATEQQRKRRFRPSFTSRNRPQLQKHGTAASSEETLKLADSAERGNAAGHHRRRESSAAPVALFTIPCCLFCLLVSAFVLLLFLVTGYHLGKYLRAANATSGAIPLPGKEEEEQLMVAGLFMAVPRTTTGQPPTDSDFQQIGAILNGASGSQPKLANELQALAQKESDSQYFDPQFGRDLVKAAKHGKTEVVRRLLDHGLDVNDTRNGYGNTALHLAATYGHLETTKLLLERGAPVEATNSKHQTALYYASCEGKQQVVQLLIQFGADVNSRGRDGNTPLHCAAEEGWDRVVDLLIQNGAKVNAKNARGFMPLHWAAQYGKLEACRVLLANGADLGARVTSNSVTALHLAAQEGHVQMLRLLLDHGANVAERDKYGWTPLHYAIRSGRISCVRLLLEHWSGDVDPRDSATLFALIDRGDDQIRELIMRKVFS